MKTSTKVIIALFVTSLILSTNLYFQNKISFYFLLLINTTSLIVAFFSWIIMMVKSEKEIMEDYQREKDNKIKQQSVQPILPDWRLPYLNMLGLDPSADSQQIKEAYRKLAMKWHPDRNSGDELAGEKFKQMKSAYEHLS